MSRIGILAPVQVVSYSSHRRAADPPASVPDAGRAWGAASRFDYSLRGYDRSADIIEDGDVDGKRALDVQWVDTYRSVRGVEEFRDVSLETVPLGDGSVDVEGIRSVTFYTGTERIRHEDRRVSGGYTSITPTIEHRKTYLRLVFPFASAMVRGTPAPADTPPLPDLDVLYGG